ncbi:hypothetical protein LUX33_46725 [Actinomadura madurae]|uniref:hypothetical protein n=1 Tax=Actinomadura madurae TaxID=1993 RepID=UPI0020D25AB9|nr:hypothetical protein [Actinomadura madurae]MCP9955125.1 hypothetical protein [Actinomadura madurae]
MPVRAGGRGVSPLNAMEPPHTSSPPCRAVTVHARFRPGTGRHDSVVPRSSSQNRVKPRPATTRSGRRPRARSRSARAARSSRPLNSSIPGTWSSGWSK